MLNVIRSAPGIAFARMIASRSDPMTPSALLETTIVLVISSRRTGRGQDTGSRDAGAGPATAPDVR